MGFKETFYPSTSTLYVTGDGPILGPLQNYKSSTIRIYVINNTFTQTANGCLNGYSKLTDVHLPDSIITINDGFLSGCGSLINLTLPKNMQYISGEQPFDWTYSLQNIFVSPENPYFCDIDGCLYSKNKTVLYYVPGGRPETIYYVPSSVIIIYNAAFSHSKIHETIVVPPSVKRFEHYIGYSSKNLQRILIAQCKSMIHVDLTSALISTNYTSNPESIIHYSPFCTHYYRTFSQTKLEICIIYKMFIFFVI